MKCIYLSIYYPYKGLLVVDVSYICVGFFHNKHICTEKQITYQSAYGTLKKYTVYYLSRHSFSILNKYFKHFLNFVEDNLVIIL